MEPHRPETPHTPPPSLWPVGFAVGVAVLLLGLIVGWGIVLLGALLTVGFGFLWVRDVVEGTPTAPAAPEPPPPQGIGAAPVPARQAEAALPAMDEEEIHRYPRNVFLEGATLGLGALIGGIVTVPALGFAVLPAFVDQEPQGSDLGPLENFPEGEWRVATFLEDPEHGEVSRRTAFVRHNGDLNGVPSFTIISNRCAHLGCPTQPQGSLNEEDSEEIEVEHGTVTLIPTNPSGFTCPCHGGAYSIEGNRTAGPPVRALDRYEFSIRDGHLWIGKAYSVGEVEGEGKDARIKKYHRFYPGEHVDGIQQILYPFPAPNL
ncbi:MAG: Rieske 2Fe-2S domain-containing protein [Thermoleophilia bacterium]|nr:Rieske 2Fe-2S domain-containing protein [Thermoleophilia bacterium]